MARAQSTNAGRGGSDCRVPAPGTERRERYLAYELQWVKGPRGERLATAVAENKRENGQSLKRDMHDRTTHRIGPTRICSCFSGRRAEPETWVAFAVTHYAEGCNAAVSGTMAKSKTASPRSNVSGGFQHMMMSRPRCSFDQRFAPARPRNGMGALG